MSKTLYVGNLLASVTVDDVHQLLGRYGTVVNSQVVLDPRTGRSLGFAFVEMADGAEAAIAALNGTQFLGRKLAVNEAQRRSDQPRHAPLPEIIERFEAHY